MPTTIAQGFAKLQDNLQITDLQETTVDTRQKSVREAVAKELTVLTSFVTGSYRRSTLIAPLAKADIDIFVILDAKYYSVDGYANLIDRVKRVLKVTYPTTPEISRNGQAVTISFTDFKVDVVPAFYRKGGGYLIPDSVMKRWIATDPTQHVTIWNTANIAHFQQLVLVIRMIKQWNRAHSALLHSFHPETLVLQILNNVTISDLPSAARFLFDKAREACKFVANDPAGYDGNIAAYLDTKEKIAEVVKRFETGYTQAAEAERLAAANQVPLAFAKWRTIFGDSFPVYA
jgi:Second Messenger Oligonucleotide or Dinucleotide Synthetase domain